MTRAYLIPPEGRSFTELSDYVSSLPIQFDGERSLVVASDGYVEVDGIIPGFDETTLRVREGAA